MFVLMIFSLCLIVSAQYLLNHSTILKKKIFTTLGVVLYYHELMCHAEKLIHFLQCQGHSVGSCNQTMTISIISSKLLVRLQPNLI